VLLIGGKLACQGVDDCAAALYFTFTPCGDVRVCVRNLDSLIELLRNRAVVADAEIEPAAEQRYRDVGPEPCEQREDHVLPE